MIKKKKRTKSSAIAWTLARAVHDLECPAREVVSNPWLFQDIMELAFEKPKIEFIMVSGGIGENTTEIYSIPTNSWRSGPDLPQPRCNHGMALVDDHNSHREIFIIGGCVDGNVTKSVISLTIPATNEMDSTMMKAVKWKVMPNLKAERVGHGVGVVGGKIFVIGGDNEREYVKTIEVFSVKEGKWLDSSSDGDHVDPQVPLEMSTERSKMGVAVIGKKIFVIGGFNRIGLMISRVEVLDTETNKWSTLPSMKTARCEMGIAVIDDRFIWIFGGWNGHDGNLDSIEIFDVEKNEWLKSLVRMTSPRRKMRTITVDHKIFIISGQEVSEMGKLVEVLDIDEMKWLEVSPMHNRLRLEHNAIGF